MRNFLLLCMLVIGACVAPIEPTVTTFDASLGSKSVELTGWLDTHGELRLFTSSQTMKADAEYPYCVSGVSLNHSRNRFSQYDRKLVRVYATVWDYNALPNEANYELARKVLGNSIITNWCRGPKVLLVDRVEIVR